VGEAPADDISTFLATTATTVRLNATRTVPVVHAIKLLAEAAWRDDDLHNVREVAFNAFRT
jgi:hypothetical protein